MTASYADALAKARDLLAQARLDDPDEHFPYKAEHARALIEENPPAGPDGPDDDSLRVTDVLPLDIAEATEKYVAAQQAYLRKPTAKALAALDKSRDLLTVARKHHRRDRVDEHGNPRLLINGGK